MQTIEKPADIHGAVCASREALELIGDRWTMIVVKAIAEGCTRYGQLHRAIDGISQKMLTQTLRKLERDGVVARKVFPVVPPKVEYSLTPLGETLIDLLIAIGVWAESNLDAVHAARKEFDFERELTLHRD